MDKVQLETVLKQFNIQAPRYTSYPPAPVWKDTMLPENFAQLLANLGKASKPVSVYLHLPFCDKMCFFCGCNTWIRTNKSSSDGYVDALVKEIELVAKASGTRLSAKQCHLGGGTPNFFSPEQTRRIFNALTTHFRFESDMESSVEVDPRTVTQDHLRAYAELGINRLSMGVQDFDPVVQKAINRVQSFEKFEAIFRWAREYRFRSINVDLIYGLPHQTVERFAETLEKLKTLRPDRIALYSYAHVPWLKSHQKLISEADLPSPETKMDIFLMARQTLLSFGYEAIAMDHFALPEDELAKATHTKTLYRNFMGYTTRPTDDFIGLGVTAIGFLVDTFTQNTRDLKTYLADLSESKLPVSRGMTLSGDDKIRQWVIQELMCQMEVKKAVFQEKFSQDFDSYFTNEKTPLLRCEKEGLIQIRSDGIYATELGKLLIRNVAMVFDVYLGKNTQQQFSKTV